MMRLALLVALVLLGAACSVGTQLIDNALERGAINERHKDFWILTQHRHGVICGKWDADNEKARNYSGYMNFIIFEDRVNKNPEPRQWYVYCSDDPAAALYRHYGIGPVTEDGGSTRQVYEDFKAILAALEAYKSDYKDYPLEIPGLAAMLPGASGDDGQSAGYISELPEDPWGRPYRYSYAGQGGMVVTHYQLYTLGKDNKRGGKGENADISAVSHMQHLWYVIEPG